MVELQSNAASRAEYPQIVIKDNNVASNDACAICGDRTDPGIGPELFLEGTVSLVCHHNCGRRYAPGLVAALETLRKAEWEAEQERQRRKQELLLRYSTKPLTQFIQFDGWWNADDVMGRDENGQGITSCVTWELMHGSDVRVLIPPRTTKEQSLVLLRKVADWIERGGLDNRIVSTAKTPSVVNDDGIAF